MMPADPEEPERWVVSTEAPPELRALLDVARREGPSIAQQASLGSRLGLSLGQAVLGVGAKALLLGTVVLAAVAGAGLGLVAGPEAAPPASSVPAQLDHPPAIVVAADQRLAPVPAPVEAPSEKTAPSSPQRAAAPKRPSEAALIRGARESLSVSTRQARTFLERHRRLYPDGQLAQEREVLLIEVLKLEGREAEASARAAEFRQKNPDSAHRPVTP